VEKIAELFISGIQENNYQKPELIFLFPRLAFRLAPLDACPVNVISKERVEKFSARARAYICTYHHLDLQELQRHGSDTTLENTTPNARPKQELLYNDIERLRKAFKSHRCALDFDSGFVNSTLKEEKKKTNDSEM
jgi:hypothetical protein